MSLTFVQYQYHALRALWGAYRNYPLTARKHGTQSLEQQLIAILYIAKL